MDNAHAHPSTPATVPRPTHRLHDDNAPSPQTRQQRLLCSRNARFPAKKISISGISARFSDLIKTGEGKRLSQTPAPRSQENLAYKKHKGYGSASLSISSLGILEEISNSVGGKAPPSQKRPPIPIFQDSPERALLDESPWVSPSAYHDASSLVGSPRVFDHIQDSLPSMGLREISGNARKSSTPESSPYPGSTRISRQRKSTQKSRFDSEEYIEHIEKELELVKNAVYSPNTNRPWKEKLKVAKAENERLRAEIHDMKVAFEAEVQKTVEHMATTEVDLRRKIRSLEEEVDQKDFVIQELETQHDEKRLDQGTVETLRSTVDRLEQEKISLEQSNDSISKRNEVLTQLLAISPPKTYPHFEASSPVRLRKNSRPRSLIIPRTPSSPGIRGDSRPHSVVASPALSAAGYFSPRQVTDTLPPSRKDGTIKNMRRDTPVDSGLGELFSIPSNSRIGSRGSTIASQASMSSTSWGLPLPASVSQDPPRQQQKRRARRFLPGSTQLKPLLLPTLAGDNGALNVISPLTSPQRKQPRDFSEESIDPTTMFLSQSATQYESDVQPLPSGPAPAVPLDHEIRDHQFQSFEGAFEPLSDPLDMPESLADPFDIPDWSQQSVSEQLERFDQFELELPKTPNSDSANASMSSPGPELADEDIEKTALPDDIALSLSNLEPIVATTQEGEVEDFGVYTLPRNRSPGELSTVEVPQPLFSPPVRLGVDQNISRRRREPQRAQDLIQQIDPCRALSVDNPHVARKRRKISSSSLLLENGAVFHLQSLSQEKNFRPAPLLDFEAVPPTLGASDTKTVSKPSSRPSSVSLRSPNRSKRPLEILQQRGIARPLAAVTIRTIYGTLSRYSTYIREIRRDPLALARRVIANAWHTNWKLIGKLSWWVLGLFLGPSRRSAEHFDWGNYDAESIAERQIETQRLLPATPNKQRRVHFEEQHDSYRTRGTKSAAIALKKKKPGWGKSLLLWGKFSIAIMMAVGGAVVQGPAEMLRDADERITDSPRKRVSRMRRPCQDDHEHFDSSSPPTQHAFEDYGLDLDEIDNDFEDFGGQQFKYRRKNSNSPPPSARSLLQDHSAIAVEQLPSPVPYQFGSGSNEIFSFEPPVSDTDWGRFEGGETLKLSTPKRAGLYSLFDSSPPDGGHEYNPESAPFAAELCLFSPLSRKSGDGRTVRYMELEGDVVEDENG